MSSKGLRHLSALLVVLGIIFVILSYFSYVASTVEQRLIDLEIGSIKRLFKAHQFIGGDVTMVSSAFKTNTTSSMVQRLIPMQKLPIVSDLWLLDKGTWGIYIPFNQLVYRIAEPTYFRSKSGKPFIHVSIISKENRKMLIVSPFDWCLKKSIWGCDKWKK